jgi:hypothetical protein
MKNRFRTRLIEFNEYNDALFNIRARSLNNLVYWLAQIVGSISIGFLLDQNSISRRIRAFAGWTILFIMVFAVHIWAYFYQRHASPTPFLTRCPTMTCKKIENTLASLSPPTRRSSTSTVPVMYQNCGYTSFVVFLIQCGKQRHIGSWAPCRTIQPNSLISPDFVRLTLSPCAATIIRITDLFQYR